MEILKVSSEIVDIRNNIFKKDDKIEFVNVDFSADDDEEDDPLYDEDDVSY